MPDLILIDGDKAIFQPTFGPAVVVVKPGDIKAKGPATLKGTKVCLDGDEKSVCVPGCVYMTPQFSVPGTGTLKIDRLAANQIAKKTNSGGKPVLLKGGSFIAKFEVQSPAQMPPLASTPDATPQYSGSGTFVTTNTKYNGT